MIIANIKTQIIALEAQFAYLLERELETKLAGDIELSLRYTDLRERNLAMTNHLLRKLEANA